MTAKQRLLDVIGQAWPLGQSRVLAALREAGYEIAPSDTAKLGRAVEAISDAQNRYNRLGYVEPRKGWDDCLDATYIAAGVERP